MFFAYPSSTQTKSWRANTSPSFFTAATATNLSYFPSFGEQTFVKRKVRGERRTKSGDGDTIRLVLLSSHPQKLLLLPLLLPVMTTIIMMITSFSRHFLPRHHLIPLGFIPFTPKTSNKWPKN